MRLLTLPDLHGKPVWRQPDPVAYDRPVFLQELPQPRLRTFGNPIKSITYADVLRTEAVFWEKTF